MGWEQLARFVDASVPTETDAAAPQPIFSQRYVIHASSGRNSLELQLVCDQCTNLHMDTAFLTVPNTASCSLYAGPPAQYESAMWTVYGVTIGVARPGGMLGVRAVCEARCLNPAHLIHVPAAPVRIARPTEKRRRVSKYEDAAARIYARTGSVHTVAWELGLRPSRVRRILGIPNSVPMAKVG
jgi:hypothetical protein